jgi:3-oxoacyl-[acyl-carrier protein] reductase
LESPPYLPNLCLGKVAVVTGSSRSTGAAVARCLGEHGASVVVNFVTDSQSAEEVVQAIRSNGKGGAIAVKANTATVEGGQLLLDEAMRTFGRIDILVLNAGVMGSKTLAEMDEGFFDVCFETNVKVPLFMAKAAARLLPARALFDRSWSLAEMPNFFHSSWWSDHILLFEPHLRL